MLVLHVGPHKTATTWLQHNFYHNVQALEQAGWHYPLTGVRVRVAHHDISDNPEEILNDASAKVREIRRIVAKAAEKNLNILLSSEGFRNWKPEHLRRLQQLAADLSERYGVRCESFAADLTDPKAPASIVDYAKLPLEVGWGQATLNPTAVAESKVLYEPVWVKGESSPFQFAPKDE